MVERSIKSLELLSIEMNKDENKALTIAENIHTTCPIIYGSEELTWVAALRFRGQLAENAKMLSFHNHFPEQNHNEIEAFENTIIDNINILWINDISIDKRTKKRIKITSEILKNYGSKHNIEFNGSNFFIRQMRIIYFLDWVSFYCAILLETNPYPIDKIKKLKSLL